MGINGVSNNTSTYSSAVQSTSTESAKSTSTAAKKQEIPADVYESGKKDSGSSKKIYKRDSETINRLLSDAKQRQQQMKDLVEKTLAKQGLTLNKSQSIFDILKTGKAEFSASDIAQAKKDVAEDGYWGVKQTAERLYSFAYALTGGDPSKADSMMAAIDKGFKQATKSWGGDLPGICQQTYDRVKEKMDAWKNTAADSTEQVTG